MVKWKENKGLGLVLVWRWGATSVRGEIFTCPLHRTRSSSLVKSTILCLHQLGLTSHSASFPSDTTYALLTCYPNPQIHSTCQTYYSQNIILSETQDPVLVFLDNQL